MTPPEIARILGLRIHPGAWNVATQTGILQLRNKPNRTAREEKRMINLLSYARRLLEAARAGQRSPLNWFMQPTGRWSTRKPRPHDPPMQWAANVHSISKGFGLRDAVIPADGFVFVRGDWTSAHLLIAAGMSRDLVLQADIEAGDAYTRAMGLLAHELGDAGRAVSKILILSALNGARPAKLAATLADHGVTVDAEEAGRRCGEWLSRYEQLATFMQVAPRTRAWTTALKRTVALPFGLPPHKGLGWRWQSNEADALTVALQKLATERPNWHVALVFYDEILLEVPRAEAEEAQAYLLQLMNRMIRGAAGLARGDAAMTTKVSIRTTWGGKEPAVWPEDGVVLRPRIQVTPVLRPRIQVTPVLRPRIGGGK